MDFIETMYYSANWIHLAKGQALVAGSCTVMNAWVPYSDQMSDC